MPDKNGNLLPGDAGYAAPVDNPPVIKTDEELALENQGSQPPNNPPVDNPPVNEPEAENEFLPGRGNVPIDKVEGVPGNPSMTSSEAMVQHAAGFRAAPDFEATQEKYNLLLAAFNKVCVRAGMDVQYETTLRREAGLI